ncbi:hypothetical protein B0O80DRAFT_424904 [Mortierella sp. GBAus27b]|nr:hypothetical protein BGX31_007652 [Mortierella sp. GBA43]KAI8356954.1 hypothetical protein B0O80DRAFT_424904 [Mortierella sp. GBAus27b]
MDRNTVHLYEALEIPKTATQDEIKKAYRRLALRYHPDKVNAAEVPDHEDKFREIAAAYEVLGDPKKRQVYDKYGMMGVQMAGTEIGAQLLEIESLLCRIFFLLSLLFILAIIFFSFLSLRVDEKVTWSYHVVFIPLWILDFILLATTLVQGLGPIDEDEEEDHQEENEEGETIPIAQEERKAEKRRQKRRQRNLATTFIMIIVLLITVFQILIARKADDPDSISGPAVFVPYFALEAIFFVIGLIQLFMEFKLGKYSETSTTGKIIAVLDALWWKFIRLALAILIMLRIDGNIDCSWGIVFIPLYVIGIKYMVQLITGYRRFSRMQNQEMRQQGQALMISGGVLFLVVGSLAYALIGLLAARLDGYSYSASNVLIPLFIVLSILLCCSGCCLPCMLLAGGVTDEGMAEEGAQIRIISPNLRIEDGSNNNSHVVSSSASSDRRSGRRANNASNTS